MDSIFGNRPIKLSALGDFSQLNKGTQQHLKNVYSCLAIAMFAAAAGSYAHLFTFLQAGLMSVFATLGLLIWLGLTPNNGQNQGKRLGLLTDLPFLRIHCRMNLGPLMIQVTRIDPTIVPTAFMATTVIFVCFSLVALYSQRRSYLFLLGPILSGLSTLLMLSLLNLFMRSQMLFQIELYLGLFIFCGFVLVDTQLIVEKCNNGDKDYIWHCVDLFLDFINIFRRLMIILGQKEEKRRK
ncbi:probable Bax inhibitor 1 [Amphiura filiformis]|uniref:probable Bax inhibitor 1 n=1 Tax=Amphiura filiformis TaxID=82378 RepID=UPI003B216813